MLEFLESVTYEYRRMAPTVVVRAARGGQMLERHVAVLTVGRFDSTGVADPAEHPWALLLDSLPFPVEVSWHVDIEAGHAVKKRIRRRLDRVRNEAREHERFGLDAPQELEATAARAKQIEHMLSQGTEVERAVAACWLRVAVWGDTQDECLARVQTLRELYQPREIQIQHPHTPATAGSQLHLLGEFVPGAQLSTTAYRRDLPVVMLAAGMPSGSSIIGDRVGDYLGDTPTGRPVFLDPHRSSEVTERSALVTVIGEPGSGKSTLLFSLLYSGVLRGINTTCVDPSGPMAAFAGLLGPRYARVLDLMSAPPGTLNVYSAIPDPIRDRYPTPEAYRDAVADADADRLALAEDVLVSLLTRAMRGQPETQALVRRAIHAHGAKRTGSLDGVLDTLAGMGRRGGRVADYLRTYAADRRARVFFGPDPDPDRVIAQDALLLVLTMPGIDLPETGSDEDQWTLLQRLSVPLNHIAAHYARRRVYGLPKDTRKLIGLDEASLLAQSGSSRTLTRRFARDSRKHNAVVVIASQDPQDMLGLDLANLTGTAMVGRLGSHDVAGEALSMLGLPPGQGYEDVLTRLSPRATTDDTTDPEPVPRGFLVKTITATGQPRVEEVRLNPMIHPAMFRAANTTPTGTEDVA
jgi:hypothetical protein